MNYFINRTKSAPKTFLVSFALPSKGSDETRIVFPASDLYEARQIANVFRKNRGNPPINFVRFFN